MYKVFLSGTARMENLFFRTRAETAALWYCTVYCVEIEPHANIFSKAVILRGGLHKQNVVYEQLGYQASRWAPHRESVATGINAFKIVKI
jgi:hypothetical protein